jgi:hypothetical protein
MTYRLLVPAFCLLAPLAAHAACSATDFAIKDFAVAAGARGTMSVEGELVNNCAEAAAAQVEVQAKDSQGNVVQAKKAWPAGTTNIAPGQSVKFNLGRQFHYELSMQAYSAGVIKVRSW